MKVCTSHFLLHCRLLFCLAQPSLASIPQTPRLLPLRSCCAIDVRLFIEESLAQSLTGTSYSAIEFYVPPRRAAFTCGADILPSLSALLMSQRPLTRTSHSHFCDAFSPIDAFTDDVGRCTHILVPSQHLSLSCSPMKTHAPRSRHPRVAHV
jgi:hypothetical protein